VVGHPAFSSLPDDAGVVGCLIANRYLIEEPCERTDASAIYRARHLHAGQIVLLRVLDGRAIVNHERCHDALALAERAGALPSPHVARTLDVGVVAERWPFVVSEYTKGRTLAGTIRREGPLPLRRLLPIARAVAGALSVAHAAGLLHGELLASGVWVESPSGRPDWVRLLDFGIQDLREPGVRASASGVYRNSAFTGAAAFSTAELRSDIQALGLLLYELASGPAVASRSSDLAELLDSRCSEPAWGGERALARGFARVVERCLSFVPEAGYRSMGAVCRDLGALAEAEFALHRATSERRPPPVTAIHAPARRARVALGGPKVIVRGG
jgi:serine/threonine protein kinase